MYVPPSIYQSSAQKFICCIASVRILNSVYSYRLYTYKYKAKQETTKTLSRLSCTDFFFSFAETHQSEQISSRPEQICELTFNDVGLVNVFKHPNAKVLCGPNRNVQPHIWTNTHFRMVVF